MSSSASESSDRDPLQKQLDDAENELRRRLEEACEAEAGGVSTESTAEVRKLEDNLLAAASAAKQTIAVRNQMKRRRYVGRERAIKIDVTADHDTQAPAPLEETTESKVDEGGENAAMDVREFTDDDLQPWRAWLVVPGQGIAKSNGRKFLGDFQDGWICFEGVGRSARRRLPYRQADWPNISDDELKHLVRQAIDAPVREKKVPGQELTDR
jgi:hypothetical protein